MPLAETVADHHLWLIVAVAACLPVSGVVFWRIARWWNSAQPLPLPIDRALPNPPWPGAAGLLLFLNLFFLMIDIGIAYQAAAQEGFLPWEPLHVPSVVSPVMFLSQIVPPLAGLLVMMMFGRGALETVSVRRGPLALGLGLGVVAFATVLPVCEIALKANQMLVWFFQVPEVTHPVLDAIAQRVRPPLWVIVLLTLQAGVLAPLGEEFIYRGILMTALLKDIGTVGAIGVSSAVFALVHLPSQPQAILPLFCLGVALAYVTYRTRSLVAAIVTHSLFNTLMVLGTLLEKVGEGTRTIGS
jgi:membrane protease YdiL (CAAX protease family)